MPQILEQPDWEMVGRGRFQQKRMPLAPAGFRVSVNVAPDMRKAFLACKPFPSNYAADKRTAGLGGGGPWTIPAEAGAIGSGKGHGFVAGHREGVEENSLGHASFYP
jgi:hypothetical protein